MGFKFKPAMLANATSAADVQKLMKADLKSNAGKKGVKFIAAKNCVIGGKTTQLFILTDNPAPFEAVIKEKHPKAYRAKGTCDLIKDKTSGATTVTIKSSVGQMLPESVVKLMPEVVAHDASILATYTKLAPDTMPALPAKVKLNKVSKVKVGGLARVDKDEYKQQSKETLIASMTTEGKIGSIYFGDEGRIRTTHSSGPAKEDHQGESIVRFNVNHMVAKLEFKKGHPGTQSSNDYRAWLSERLKNVTPQNLPNWAELVDSPATARPAKKGKLSPDVDFFDIKLFEIFKDINGDVENWHPSRGTAVTYETDTQTISVLKAAIEFIDGRTKDSKGKLIPALTDPGARNVAFYDFVKSRLPKSKLVKAMRKPGKV